MQNIIRVQRVSNPSTGRRRKASSKSRGRKAKTSRRRRRSNPLRVLTLGASNPRRKTKVATRRKKATTRRRRRTTAAAPRRRRRNYTARARNARRAAPRRRRRNATRITIRRTRRNGRRRNPNLFGSSVSAAAMTEAVLGGLVGVTAAKLIPASLPGNLTSTPTMRILSSVASAFGAGWVAGKVSPRFGDAVLFGGLMQAGSIILNAFVPAIGGQIGLQGMRGLGELMAGAYPVPQNPLNPNQANYPAYGRPMVAAGNGTYGATAPVTMNGLARAFGPAF